MTFDTKERYIGDGVYASLDEANMIILRTDRGVRLPDSAHWIALEPEVFRELLRYAWEIGWHDIVKNAHPPWRYFPSDEEYARDAEDQQRKRDAAEGFDD